MSVETNEGTAVEPEVPVVIIPEKYASKVADILEYTKGAFSVPFEFHLDHGAEDSFFMVGPYGTLVIALGVTPEGKPDERIDAISVSLDADPHQAAVTAHAYASLFGLSFMAPHAQGVGEAYNQILFGEQAYGAKALLDEARVRAKVVELTREASRQVSAEKEPTLADKIMGGPKVLIDAHGRELK